MFKVATTKAFQWKYEKEIRMLIPKDFYEDDIVPLSPECIHSVYMGCRMEEPEKLKVINTVFGKIGLEHVKLFQADMSPKSYKLSFTRLLPPVRNKKW